MLFAFDEDGVRSDVPSDFVRFFGSGFLSSILEILAVRAGRIWPVRWSPFSVS
jgi:hypothetical protein